MVRPYRFGFVFVPERALFRVRWKGPMPKQYGPDNSRPRDEIELRLAFLGGP